MVIEKSWEEFRDSGFLWLANRALHLFGWAIVYTVDDQTGAVTGVYPARVRFRGFEAEAEARGFQRVAEFAAQHAAELLAETRE